MKVLFLEETGTTFVCDNSAKCFHIWPHLMAKLIGKIPSASSLPPASRLLLSTDVRFKEFPSSMRSMIRERCAMGGQGMQFGRQPVDTLWRLRYVDKW